MLTAQDLAAIANYEKAIIDRINAEQDPSDFSEVSTAKVYISLTESSNGAYLNIRCCDSSDSSHGQLATAYLKPRALKAVKAKLLELGKGNVYKVYREALVELKGVSFTYRY